MPVTLLESLLARTTDGFGAEKQKAKDIYEAYDFESGQRLLGVGAFGKVSKARSKITGNSCAVKQVLVKDNMHHEKVVKEEAQMMKTLNHRNVVRLIETFQDDRHFYIVMELCAGGRLPDYVAATRSFDESDVAVAMQQLFVALGYLHGQGMCHRDIKPENCLLEHWCPIKDNTLKLVDFGLACTCRSAVGEGLRLRAGTLEYMAPEVCDGRLYDFSADMWSAGVMMFVLLCGYTPFRAETEAGVIAAVRRGNFFFQGHDWKDVSEDAKDCIRHLLKLQPKDRLTSRDASEHRWVRQLAPNSTGAQLRSAISRFSALQARRNVPQAEADAFADVPEMMRAAWSDVTQWVMRISS